MAKGSGSQTPLMQQYWQIKSVHDDKILLFRMGDFFEMFHDDAVVAAPILGIALTQRNKKAEDSTPMCGVPHHSIAGPINKLLAEGFKVAICDQIEDPKKAKGLVKRAVTRVLTPGMVYDPDQLESDQPNYLCSVGADSVAFLEASTHEAFYYSGISRQQVQRLIQVLSPVEMVGQDFEFGENIHKSPHEVEAGQFHQVEPVNHLISYCQTLSDTAIAYDFVKRELQASMPLSSNVIRHLEIYSTYLGDKKGSLFSALNNCKTSSGSRLLKRWLSFPLISVEKIKQRQEIVNWFSNHYSVIDQVREDFQGVGDVERRLSKIETQGCHPREVQTLSENLKAGMRVCHQIDTMDGRYNWDIEQLQRAIDLVDCIDRTLADELPNQLKDGGFIRKGYLKELDEYIELSENATAKLREMEEREREQTSIPSLKIRYNNVFGYYIEVTNAHKSKVPEHYLRKQTLTNAERYCTDELQGLERKILAAKSKRIALENQIFEDLRAEVVKVNSVLLSLVQKWSEIDVLSSFALLSIQHKYVTPEFTDVVRLLDCRHPVVERGTQFVPNTIEMKPGECMLLTGPNMAGKSTIMRQVAIISLMAQIGCNVPAESAQLPVFDRIFTRIGASDHLSEGLSTFMVEMLEAAEIVKESTQNSLIVLDEIGRGTSTFDGMSLAQGLLEFILTERKAITFFATHYHELTELSEDMPQLKNHHMSIQDQSGQFEFLHTLKPGPANKSYGIHVAELAGLPKKVTQRAKSLLKVHERKSLSSGVSSQLSFLDVEPEAELSEVVESPILQSLRELKIEAMTPIQAFEMIQQWQHEVRN